MTMSKNWRQIFKEHVVELSECTRVGSEMLTHLIKYRLILDTEKDILVKSADYDRATTLYNGISRRWDDVDFEKFMEALKEGRNTRALKILSQQELGNQKSNLRMADLETPGRQSTMWESFRTRGVVSEEQPTATMFRLAEVQRKGEAILANPNRVTALEETLQNVESQNVKLQAEMVLVKENWRNDMAKLREDLRALEVSSRSKDAELEGRLGKVEQIEKETQVNLSGVHYGMSALEILSSTLRDETKEFNVQVSDLRSKTAESFEKLQVAVKKLETSCKEWTLGGHIAFDCNKTMGTWFLIEVIDRSKNNTEFAFLKFVFTLTGNNIIVTHTTRGFKGQCKRTEVWDCTVDTLSSHQWNHSNGKDVSTWLKTDYENSGLVMKGNIVWILSRQTTLPLETLDLLRDIAKESEIPKENVRPVNQTMQTNLSR